MILHKRGQGGLIDLKLPRNGAEGLCQTQGKLSGDPLHCRNSSLSEPTRDSVSSK